MERMKIENDRMLEEAAKVRQEDTQAFLLEPQPFRTTTFHYRRACTDAMSSRLDLKAKRHFEDYVTEKLNRERKEDDLRLAEEQIVKLKEHFRQLKDILEVASKRPILAREEGDSPELHALKKVKTDEVTPLALTQFGEEPVITQSSAVLYRAIPVEPLPRRDAIILDSTVLNSTVLDSSIKIARINLT